MRVKWLGHASLLITSDKGTRLATDPYSLSGGIAYGAIHETAEVVTVSHEHFDHNNVAAVTGRPEVVREATKKVVKDIEVRGVPSHHDTSQGKQRGSNMIFCFMVDGVRACHLGDLGHVLTPEQVAQIGAVDVLFVPVGGVYTVDAAGATKVVEQVKPRVAVPMHFKTPKVNMPLAPVEDFLKGKDRVRRVEGSEVEFKVGQLPQPTEIVVLKPAL